MKNKYTIKTFGEGIIYQSDPNRLTVMLMVPYYSFDPRYETRRVSAPMGLELIANELYTEGFNIIFIDAARADYNNLIKQPDGTYRYGLSNDKLKNLLKKFKPDVVGITNLFSNQSNNVKHTSNIVREVYPKSIIVEGGAHATGADIEVLQYDNVDVVVRGEGIKIFTQLCKEIEINRNGDNIELARIFNKIKGISFKTKSGKIIRNPSQEFIQNLDEIAPRMFDIELHKMYNTTRHTGGTRKKTDGRYAYVMTSFGCNGHCKFCTSDILSGPKTRFFSLKRIEEEIKRLKEAGVNELIIEDDQFLANIPRAMSVMEIFKKYNMRWFEEGGISMFKLMIPGHGFTYKNIIDKMAESGCYRFYLAIESANIGSLQQSNKPYINAEANKAEEIVRYITSKGIEAVGGFMLGFKLPNFEETLEDMENTIRYAKRLKKAGLAFVMLFIYTALPGTQIYPYMRPLMLRGYTSHEKASCMVDDLTPEQLTELRYKWMKEINGEKIMSKIKESLNWGI